MNINRTSRVRSIFTSLHTTLVLCPLTALFLVGAVLVLLFGGMTRIALTGRRSA